MCIRDRVNPTGIIFIAFDKQKIQAIIVKIQKIVGVNTVKPFVDFKKPLENIPSKIAKTKNIYPDKFTISLTCLTK